LDRLYISKRRTWIVRAYYLRVGFSVPAWSGRNVHFRLASSINVWTRSK